MEELGDTPGFQYKVDLVLRFHHLAALVKDYDQIHYPIPPAAAEDIEKLKNEYKKSND